MDTSNNRSSRTIKPLACIERKQGAEQLRIDLDEFTDQKGHTHRYVSARKWFRTNDGRILPTKEGFTIRRNELGNVMRALNDALALLSDERSIEPQPAIEVRQPRESRGEQANAASDGTPDPF